ncbi:prealbumin-like fold domain-containing protein [Nocardia sp. NPDC050710]|uniref:prealbumin-like fold domain-containing protein n=1 Tax=Nocardia sp. NPDC050710 TaxID=3157220 RepID=UPI0033D4FA2F
MSIVGAACAAGLAGGAASAQAPESITVSAVTGSDQLPVTGVEVGVTTCVAGPVLATLTTGVDGTATTNLAPGCYQLQVTSVPSGCMLDGEAYTQVTVLPGITVTPRYQFRCA